MKKLVVLLVMMLMAGSLHTAMAIPQTYDLDAMTLEELTLLQAAVQEKIQALTPAVTSTVGSTSRKSPAGKNQPIELEMDMYGEYMYTCIVTMVDAKLKDDQAVYVFGIKMGEYSDGNDREFSIWSTDFAMYSTDGVELARSAKNVDVPENIPSLSWNYSMYSNSSAQIAVVFEGVTADAPLVRFEVTNKNKFDDANRAKSCVWFDPAK